MRLEPSDQKTKQRVKCLRKKPHLASRKERKSFVEKVVLKMDLKGWRVRKINIRERRKGDSRLER